MDAVEDEASFTFAFPDRCVHAIMTVYLFIYFSDCTLLHIRTSDILLSIILERHLRLLMSYSRDVIIEFLQSLNKHSTLFIDLAHSI